MEQSNKSLLNATLTTVEILPGSNLMKCIQGAALITRKSCIIYPRTLLYPVFPEQPGFKHSLSYMLCVTLMFKWAVNKSSKVCWCEIGQPFVNTAPCFHRVIRQCWCHFMLTGKAWITTTPQVKAGGKKYGHWQESVKINSWLWKCIA